MEIDGGQVTVSVTDPVLLALALEGSSFASMAAVFVRSPHSTSPVKRTVKVTDADAPAGIDARSQNTE
jgi:hypothetical protein